MRIRSPFAWDRASEVNKETEPDKKEKRVLGAAVVNTGERGRGAAETQPVCQQFTHEIAENLPFT